MSNKKVDLASLDPKRVFNQRNGTHEYQSNDTRRRIGVKKTTRSDQKSRLLKVKFPKLVKPSLSKDMKNKETTKEYMFTPPKVAEMVCEPVEDPFFFSQRPQSKASSEKDRVRLAVVRTIYKMVEENKLIRERLASLKETV
ncbi:uncharacterized protein [Nerophis lumbriciformis]|uniref:uncharacterized protein isoform X2 n=1 Tax=Nerophis lumbriciformis TaxID=546530 RepID=UPI003BAC6117